MRGQREKPSSSSYQGNPGKRLLKKEQVKKGILVSSGVTALPLLEIGKSQNHSRGPEKGGAQKGA